MYGTASGASVSDATARICACLKRLRPRKTAESVAAETGLSADAFTKWDAGLAEPSGKSLRALFEAYDVPVIIAWLGGCPAWLEPAARAKHAADRAAALADLEARFAELDHI